MSDLLAAYQDLQDDWAETEAQGGSIERPEPGEYNVQITALKLEETTVRVAAENKDVPALGVQFRYKLLNDPDHAEPLEFPGEQFRLARKPSDLPEGHQKAYKISMGRLKGYLKVILDEEPANIVEALGTVLEQLEQGVLCVKIRCRQKPNKKNKEFTDYNQDVLELISS